MNIKKWNYDHNDNGDGEAFFLFLNFVQNSNFNKPIYSRGRKSNITVTRLRGNARGVTLVVDHHSVSVLKAKTIRVFRGTRTLEYMEEDNLEKPI